MASLTIALGAFCLFLGSRATPCLDDGMAMFQSHVKMSSSISTDVKLVQEAMTVSAEMLADIDEKLVNLTKYVESFRSTLESKPEGEKKVALMKFKSSLPMLEALDNQVLKAGDDMATLSWDWVEAAFGSQGPSHTSLHSAAKVAEGSKVLKAMFGNTTKNNMISSAIMAADSIDNLDDEAKWATGNALETTMKKIADQLTAADETVDGAMKLLADTLSSVAKESSVSAEVQESVAKVPEAMARLEKDSVNVFFNNIEKPFETAFEDLSVTEEHRAKDAAKDVEKVAAKVHKIAQIVTKTEMTLMKVILADPGMSFLLPPAKRFSR